MSFEVVVIHHLDDDTYETEMDVIERKEKSIIGTISVKYTYIFEEYEHKTGKKPIIYVGNRQVTNYERLPLENVYESDEEWGKICLFPRSKYEFIF